MSPEGWYRINIMYDTNVKALPGSPLETAYMILFSKREEIEALKDQLNIWLAMLPLKAEEAADQVSKITKKLNLARNPFAKDNEKEVKDRFKKAMDNWIKKGPLSVNSLTMNREELRRARLEEVGSQYLKEKK